MLNEPLLAFLKAILVDDLRKSVKWLPKVCAFLFEKTGRNVSLNCVIPNVGNESEFNTFRSDILESLRGLDISLSEEFQLPSPRCFVLFGKDDEYDLDQNATDIGSERLRI